MEQFQFEKLILKRYDSRGEMGEAAGAHAVAIMKKLLAQKSEINVLFAAAPSQNEVLAAVASSDVDFSRIHALHMDEYIGLAKDAPQRFSHYLDEHIFGLCPFKSVAYLGAVEVGEAMCNRYEQTLRGHPLDMAFIGLGENGHIAFNDPHEADFQDKALVKIVSLDQRCREQQVHDGCFESLDKVPSQAVTLTIPAIMAAPYLVCTVPAAAKAEAVMRTAHDPISEACPGTILRTHQNCVLFCDAQSGKHL